MATAKEIQKQILRDEFCVNGEALFKALHMEFRFDCHDRIKQPTCLHHGKFAPDRADYHEPWFLRRVFLPLMSAGVEMWLRKAYEDSQSRAALVVAVVPLQTHTSWWHDFATKASEIRYPEARYVCERGCTSKMAILIFRPKDLC